MLNRKNIFYLVILSGFIIFSFSPDKEMEQKNIFEPPVSIDKASVWADSILSLMTLEEKISFIGGDRIFFTEAIPRLNISSVMMADATQGVHLRKSFNEFRYEEVLPTSTAFPCPLLLASTWNKDLAEQYAVSIGEECRAGGISVLLGPGMNMYRISQCGRNFEYFGEDPFLASEMIRNYVTGLQSTGTIATLKHFVANNSDFFRRKSNSIVDDRAIHEIYTPAFKAGIDAGAMAVMTSYNLLNGEWCGQSDFVINDLLRKQLGFKWLVMTDWWSVYDGQKVIKSGQDLEMPARLATDSTMKLIQQGKVDESDINKMVLSTLKTLYAMHAFNRETEPKFLSNFEKHESVALQTAREGIVLLRNEKNILPLEVSNGKILLIGDYIDNIAHGGGAATVEGYNKITLEQALKDEFGDHLIVNKNATDSEISTAGTVILSIGTFDSEGSDRPFDLPSEKEEVIQRIASLNPNVVVVINSGSGINMTRWYNRVKAILYAWYGGQNGSKAVAEIISGKINPSGKLPISIEKDFKDSPGYGYLPVGEQLYSGWKDDVEKTKPVFDVVYKEGIFIGYRWYEKNKIKPLFPFGFGLSYTTFKYSNIKISNKILSANDKIEVSFEITNTGLKSGFETAQMYISDIESSLPRPVKELKGFEKIFLEPGKSAIITMIIGKDDLSFWSPEKGGWIAEPGKFDILVGSSSEDIKLNSAIELR
jgi:beta-glucosidase